VTLVPSMTTSNFLTTFASLSSVFIAFKISAPLPKILTTLTAPYLRRLNFKRNNFL